MLAFSVRCSYRSLVDRLLGMRLHYINPKMNRQVSFEFMNQQVCTLSFLQAFLGMHSCSIQCTVCVSRHARRVPLPQLVWSGLAEFLMFVMPLLNLPLLRAWLSRALRFILGALGLAHNGDGADADNESDGDGDGGGASGCVVCAADPIAVPYAAAPCGHLYCYTCLAGSRLAEPSARFRCPRCDAAVTEIARARPALRLGARATRAPSTSSSSSSSAQ